MSNDPLQPHSHDNNVIPPGDDASLSLHLVDGSQQALTLEQLASYPQSSITYSYSTDHGTHGPYLLSGVALRDLVGDDEFKEIEVISADNFGNRIFVNELGATDEPILLCTHSDGQTLSRQHGLVRLVVPSEIDNALRQIKWVKTIRLVA